MAYPPKLLNDDGTASIATALMLSHHGFRRDLARFATALDRVAAGDGSKIEALRDEWQSFHLTLHGHHDAEDKGVFPAIAAQHESVAPDVIEKVCALLPEDLLARLPAARAAFEARCARVWGSCRAGATRTPIPDGIGG